MYDHYKLLIPTLTPYTSSKFANYDCPVGIWTVSPDTGVQQEVLLYPITSLVAEFGGTLGLFLGFSFMTLWDWGKVVGDRIKVLKRAVQNKDLGNNKV